MNRKARKEAAKAEKFRKQAIAIEKKQAAYVLTLQEKQFEAERLVLLPETVRVEKSDRVGDYLVLWGHDTYPIFARRDRYIDATIVAESLEAFLYLFPLPSMSPTAIGPWVCFYNEVREAIKEKIRLVCTQDCGWEDV